MKAITLWQPWASLLACGVKQFETRSWATSYRGPIAIHAAQKPFYKVLKELFPLHEWKYSPDYSAKRKFVDYISRFVDIDTLCYGAVIATAELVDCHKIVIYGGRGISGDGQGWLDVDGKGIYEPPEQELRLGNWTLGRYAWEFANIQILDEPIPAKGGQRIWNWREEK